MNIFLNDLIRRKLRRKEKRKKKNCKISARNVKIKNKTKSVIFLLKLFLCFFRSKKNKELREREKILRITDFVRKKETKKIGKRTARKRCDIYSFLYIY